MKKFILPVIAIAAAAIVAVIIAVTAGNKEDVYRLIKVNSYEGSVYIHREETMNAFEGLQLISEDSVEVGEASLLELIADSDKHIVAEENTNFVIHSVGNEKSGNITIDLLCGKSLFTIENKLPDGSEFVVNTPNAALSVRGTVFHVTYDPETEITTVEVKEGVVEVVSAEGMQMIEAGGSCVIGDESTDSENSVSTGVVVPAPIIESIDTAENEEAPPVISSTITLAEFESTYIEEHIQLTSENILDYFEINEDGDLYSLGFKEGYTVYKDGCTVNYKTASTEGSMSFPFFGSIGPLTTTLSEAEEILNSINEASGTIIKYSVPDNMWNENNMIFIIDDEGITHPLDR